MAMDFMNDSWLCGNCLIGARYESRQEMTTIGAAPVAPGAGPPDHRDHALAARPMPDLTAGTVYVTIKL